MTACSRSSRKCNERVSKFYHLCLSFGHIFRRDQFRNLVIYKSCINKKLWLYTDYFTTGLQYTFCKFSHQARF